jgi:hypothetical protein
MSGVALRHVGDSCAKHHANRAESCNHCRPIKSAQEAGIMARLPGECDLPALLNLAVED